MFTPCLQVTSPKVGPRLCVSLYDDFLSTAAVPGSFIYTLPDSNSFLNDRYVFVVVMKSNE